VAEKGEQLFNQIVVCHKLFFKKYKIRGKIEISITHIAPVKKIALVGPKLQLVVSDFLTHADNSGL